MTPGNRQILLCLQDNIQKIGSESNSHELKGLAHAMSAAVHELILRCNTEFYRQYYSRGRDIVGTWLELVGTDALSLDSHLSKLPKSLDESCSTEVVGKHLDALTECMVETVRLAGASDKPESKKHLERATEWEMEIHKRRAERTVPSGTETTQPGFSKQEIETYLIKKQPGWKSLRVTRLQVLSGGFSKNTMLFSTVDDVNGEQSLVIRANQRKQILEIEGNSVIHEFPFLQYAYQLDMRVPEPLWLEANEAHFGAPFLVSRQAEGEIIGSGHTGKAYQTITKETKTSLIENLLRIHGTPVGNDADIGQSRMLSAWAGFENFNQVAVATAEWWRHGAIGRDVIVSTMIQRTYDWLLANAPESPGSPVLLHGDYGLHNILIKNNAVEAILDWEQAKIGDPAEDFVPLFSSMGVDYDEEMVDLYQSLGGQPISSYNIYYYKVVTVLKVLIFDAAIKEVLSTNPQASINLYVWMTDAVYALVHGIEQLIKKAEAQKPSPAAQEYRGTR